MTLLTTIRPKVSLLISSLASDLNTIFERGLFADLHVVTNDGQLLKANELVLSSRSPTFSELFNDKVKSFQTGSLCMVNFDSCTMKEVLRFISINEVIKLEGLAYFMIYAADKFQLTALKEICVDFIIGSLTLANVSRSFFITQQMSGAEKLDDYCMELLIRFVNSD